MVRILAIVILLSGACTTRSGAKIGMGVGAVTVLGGGLLFATGDLGNDHGDKDAEQQRSILGLGLGVVGGLTALLSLLVYVTTEEPAPGPAHPIHHQPR